ncbi:hypothetical protein F5B17DRAFT_406901 [Nemania serpens]|nr:hypothetical protein F5B17DRAFT_406901 [Nemania serpens]
MSVAVTTTAPKDAAATSSAPVLPAPCYNSCNNANLEAQSLVGKSPELCSPDSRFYFYYNSCLSCVEAVAGKDEYDARSYLDAEFGQYLAYCSAIPPETVSGQPPIQSTTSPSTPPPLTASTSLVEYTFVATISYTATYNGIITVWPLEKTLISFAPLPNTTLITITTSENGHRTVWEFTKTLTPLPSDAAVPDTEYAPSAVISQTTTTTDNPTPANTTIESKPKSQAWIAGPVIGGIAGVAILLLAAWFLFRLNKNSQETYEVHGETAIKSELEVKPQAQELDGQERGRQPVELHGNCL